MNEKTPRERNGRLAGLLREQLNDMMAAAHGLGEGLACGSREAEYLAVINRNLCRQLRMVRCLELEHKLSSEDEVRLTLAPVDLVAMCQELMEEVESIVGPVGIKAVFETGLKELVVYADRARLEDMILSLISNSVKAMGKSGLLSLGLEKREDKALFILTDNGGGASAAAVAEFFGEAEEEYDIPKEPTLGLGLSLARKIAALHGGFTLADSYEGRGMRLVVSISSKLTGDDRALRTPRPEIREGGWSKVVVELSEWLPASFFALKEHCE